MFPFNLFISQLYMIIISFQTNMDINGHPTIVTHQCRPGTLKFRLLILQDSKTRLTRFNLADFHRSGSHRWIINADCPAFLTVHFELINKSSCTIWLVVYSQCVQRAQHGSREGTWQNLVTV